MRSQLSFLAVASLLTTIQAHSMFTTLYVNGESQGDGTCVRLNKTATTAWIKDITSDEMSCGITGLQKVDRTCPIKAGDTVSFRWQNHPGTGRMSVIAASHNGTCGVYMRQMSSGEPSSDGSFPNESPAGEGWFKIMYDGQDASGKWCTRRLIESPEGVVSVKIPSDVKPGYYLLRPEILSLHHARQGNPQFYVGCAQVYISGGTGTAEPETVAIPGYVNMSMPAMTFNIYEPNLGPYPGFGPALYKSGTTTSADSTTKKPAVLSAGSSMGVPTSSLAPSTFITSILPTKTAIAAQVTPTQDPEPADACSGGKDKRSQTPSHKVRDTSLASTFACPAGTIYAVGNLCLPEVPAWTDTDQSMPNCLASSKKCWETNSLCWNTTSPAVFSHSDHGCYLYEYRCRGIDKSCDRKVMQGPPDAGKNLNPPQVKLNSFGITA